MRRLIRALGAFAFVTAVHPVVQAVDDSHPPPPPPLSVESFVNYMRTDAYGPVAAISPDGSFAAFAPATVAYTHQLRIVSLTDGSSRALTELADDASAPSWSPDGKSLAFFMLRDRQYGLWIWQRESGATKHVSQVSVAPLPPWHRPLWTPDGRRILVALATDYFAPRELAPGPPSPREPSVLTFGANESDAGTRLPSDRPPISDGIGLVDVQTGEVRKLSRGEVDSYQADPTGRRVAMLEHLPRVNRSKFEVVKRLWIIDLRTGTSTIASNLVTATNGKMTWSPNGQHCAWVQDYSPEIGPAVLASIAHGRMILRSIRTEHPETKFATDRYEGRQPLWDRKSQHVFLVAAGQLWVGTPATAVARRLTNNIGEWELVELVSGFAPGTAASIDNFRSVIAAVFNTRTYREGFARVDLHTGTLSMLMEGDIHLVDGGENSNKPIMSADGKHLLYTAQATDQPPALWLSDLQFRDVRRLVPFNPDFEGRKFGVSRLLQWKNTRGDTLSGALLLPADDQPRQQPEQQHPLLLDIYAGSGASRSKNTFGLAPDASGHFWSQRGFAVFSPDTHLRIGTPVADLVDDVMPGLDAVIATGIVDRDRVAVQGHSYGGYNVMALITHSDRFRAAVSASGFAELTTSVYGNGGRGTLQPGWAEDGQGRMSGSPWDHPQEYIDNSPFWQLNRVHTPLLLIHGGADDTVPTFASTMILNGLQRLGREVKMRLYPKEGHAISLPANRIDEMSYRSVWLDQRMDLVRDSTGRLQFDGGKPRSRNAAISSTSADTR